MTPVTSTQLSSALKRVQCFKEVTWGTPGAATSKWMGISPNPTWKPYSKPNIFEEQRGSLVSAFTSAITKNGAEWGVKGFATYEDLLFLGYAGIKGDVSPTGGGPYTYVFTAPTSDAWAVQPYSLEYGYDVGTVFLRGCMPDKIKLSGEAEKWWDFDMSGFAKSYALPPTINIASSTNASPIEITTSVNHGLVSGDAVVISGHLVNTAANGHWNIVKVSDTKFTLTGSTGNGIGDATGIATKSVTKGIADRTVEAILMADTALALDPLETAPGTTPVPGTILKFELDIETGLVAHWTGGDLNPLVFVYETFKPKLSLDLLFTQTVRNFITTNLETNIGAAVQLKATSGSKVAQIDFAGVLSDDISYWPDKNGAKTVTLKMDGLYDKTSLLNTFKLTVTNNVAALP
jgi:hypothetical protein